MIFISLQISSGFSVTKEERLNGIIIKKDGIEFDSLSLENGFNNCNMDTNGELFVVGMIKPNDFFVDVGANVGDWALRAFAHEPNISGACFEPIPLIFSKLQENLKDRSVIFCPYALSDHPGNSLFAYYPTEPQLSSVFRRLDEKMYKIKPMMIPVLLERLDTLCQFYGISNINIMKIDVEGSEYKVMLGSERLLENKLIDVIQFEYATTYLSSQSTLKEIYHFLSKYGFTIYRITSWGLIEITEWRDNLENYYFSNYVALRNN